MPNEFDNTIADNQEKVVKIPENVTEIERSAYCERSDIHNIIIPDTVTRIRDHAFAKSSIKHVIWPLNASEVSTSTFYQCANLEWINLPEGVTEIYDYAFLGCTKLQYVIIPPTVAYVGENVFANCNRLLEIHVPESLRDKGKDVFKCNTPAQVFYYKSIEDLKKRVNDIRKAKIMKLQAFYRGRRNMQQAKIQRTLRTHGVRPSNYNALSFFERDIVNAFVSLFANSIPRSNPNISSVETTTDSKRTISSEPKKCNRSFNGVIRRNLIAEKKKK